MRKKSRLWLSKSKRQRKKQAQTVSQSPCPTDGVDSGLVMDPPTTDNLGKGNDTDILGKASEMNSTGAGKSGTVEGRQDPTIATDDWSALTEKLSGTGKEFVVLTSDPRCGDGAKYGSRLGRIFLDYNPDILNKFISICTEHYVGTEAERQSVSITKSNIRSGLPSSGYRRKISSSHPKPPEGDMENMLKDNFPDSDVAETNTEYMQSEETLEDDEDFRDISDEDSNEEDKHAWKQSEIVVDRKQNKTGDEMGGDSKPDEMADCKPTIKNSPKKRITKESSILQPKKGRRTLAKEKQTENRKKKQNDNISKAFQRPERAVQTKRSQRLSRKVNKVKYRDSEEVSGTEKKEDVVDTNMECPGCGDTLSDQSRFVKHVLSVHTLERKNKQKTKNISWNINTKQCPICGQFTEAEGMNFHVFVHCSDVLKYPCNRCSFVFLKLDQLVEHHEKEHGSTIGELSLFPSNHTKEDTSDALRCKECGIQIKNHEKHLCIYDKKSVYKCHFCGTHFKVRSSYLKHMRSHKGQSPYKCNSCDREYVRKFDLNKHMSTHQGAGPVYRCDVCDKTFKTRSGKYTHKMYAHGDRGLSKYGKDKFDCKYCGGVLGSHHALVRHEHRHEQATEGHIEKMGDLMDMARDVCKVVTLEDLKKKDPSACSVSNTDTLQKVESSEAVDTICLPPLSETDNSYVPESCSSETVNETMENVDDSIGSDSVVGEMTAGEVDGSDSVVFEPIDAQRQSATNIGKTWHACGICNMQFTSLRSLTEHKNIHSESGKYACDLCGKIFLKTLSLYKHRQLHDKTGKFTCKTCFKQFKSIESLRRHAKIHLEVKPFVCNVCGKGCTEKRNLASHMLVHTKKKEFICEVCGKAYRSQQQLKEHGYIHTGERPYKCTVCDLAFRSHDVLRNHSAIHSAFKKFMCDTCGKTFRQRSCMITHKHSHSKEPTHICKVCGQGCKSSSSLNSHFISFHLKPEDVASYNLTVYACDVCGKMFGEKQDHERHLRTHTGEKPFNCTICMKTFSDKSNLRSHIRSHNNDRSKKCLICGKGFMFNRDLKKHMMSHSNKPRVCVVEAIKSEEDQNVSMIPIADNIVTVITETGAAQQELQDQLVPPAAVAYEMVAATLPLHVADNFTSEVQSVSHEEDMRAVTMMQEASMVQMGVYSNTGDLTWHTL